MNKRQAKKMRRKVTYPLVDEMNLLTYTTPEEYENAQKDFEQYVQRHCRYKHYKDKGKIRGGLFYHFPVGEAYKKYFEEMLRTTRCFNVSTQVTQSVQ